MVAFLTSTDFAVIAGVVVLCIAAIHAPQLGPVRPPRLSPIWLARNYWITMILVGGLLMGLATIFYLWDVIRSVHAVVDRLRADAADPGTDAETIRNLATAIAVLLGTLAASATLAFQLVRVWTTERQTRTAEQGHITDRINKAVENLGADKSLSQFGRSLAWYDNFDRKVLRWKFQVEGEASVLPKGIEPDWDISGNYENLTQTVPNIEVRIGAIYALERISQDSLRDHVQIMEILCAYIRQNAPLRAADWDKEEEVPPREDVQIALTVLGRRFSRIPEKSNDMRIEEERHAFYLDLSHCCLRNAGFLDADFTRADFLGAQMEGCIALRTRFDGANFSDCNLHSATMNASRLQGATLRHASFERAMLRQLTLPLDFSDYPPLSEPSFADADFRGSVIRFRNEVWSEPDCPPLRYDRHGCNFTGAILAGATIVGLQSGSRHFWGREASGAAFRNCRLSTETAEEFDLAGCFGDATVTLPRDYKSGEGTLAHWSTKRLSEWEFRAACRAWKPNYAFPSN